MPALRLIYHPGYDLSLGDHVFPSHKYRLIHARLLAEGFGFVEPAPATDADMLLVHDAEWIDKLREGTLTQRDILRLEIPYSYAMVDAFWLATGGTILAARNALQEGIGFNIGGGFHHAFANYGEGFCAINDVAVAIRRLQKDGLVRSALVVDCDVHHGNGTAAIFARDPDVATLSIHQLNNYPFEKPSSTIDIDLPDGTGDEEYLRRLHDACDMAAGYAPDIIFYVAGADPFHGDQLGGLRLTIEGLRRRDKLVVDFARTRSIPLAIVLAGGYAANVEDTVTIHCNTAKAAAL